MFVLYSQNYAARALPILFNTPKKSLLKSSYPSQIFVPKKILASKISNPKKSFDHPHHLKSRVPPWAFKDGNDGNVMFVGSINGLKNDLAIHDTALVRASVPFLGRQFVVKQGSDLFMEHLTGWHQRSLMVRGMEGRRISGMFSFGHTFYTSRTIL